MAASDRSGASSRVEIVGGLGSLALPAELRACRASSPRVEAPRRGAGRPTGCPRADTAFTRRPYRGGVRVLLAVSRASLLVAARRRRRRRRRRSGRIGLRRARDVGRHLRQRGLRGSPRRPRAHRRARVKTVWVETANYGARADVVQPVRLGRFVEALHARGVRVVAWYLPGHVKPGLDLRRARAMLSFRTPRGGAFDGIALNIEGTQLRERRAPLEAGGGDLTARVRAAAGDIPLAIVPFNPRGLERRPSTLAALPVGRARAERGRVRADDLHGRRVHGLRRDVRLRRRARSASCARTAGDPDVAIHVAGGVADRLGREELEGFAAAVADDGRTIGVSLYDWGRPRRRARGAPSRRLRRYEARPRAAGRASRAGARGCTFTSASTGMKFVSPDQRGTTWRWTWSAMPAPATRPRFQPRLKPSGPVDAVERVDAGDREAVELERLLVRELRRASPTCRAARPAGAPRSTGTCSGSRSRSRRGARGATRPPAARRRLGAEDAARELVRLLDVLEPPGRPERLRHAPFYQRLRGWPHASYTRRGMAWWAKVLGLAARGPAARRARDRHLRERIWCQVGHRRRDRRRVRWASLLRLVDDRKDSASRSGLEDI